MDVFVICITQSNIQNTHQHNLNHRDLVPPENKHLQHRKSGTNILDILTKTNFLNESLSNVCTELSQSPHLVTLVSCVFS